VITQGRLSTSGGATAGPKASRAERGFPVSNAQKQGVREAPKADASTRNSIDKLGKRPGAGVPGGSPASVDRPAVVGAVNICFTGGKNRRKKNTIGCVHLPNHRNALNPTPLSSSNWMRGINLRYLQRSPGEGGGGDGTATQKAGNNRRVLGTVWHPPLKDHAVQVACSHEGERYRFRSGPKRRIFQSGSPTTIVSRGGGPPEVWAQISRRELFPHAGAWFLRVCFRMGRAVPPKGH